MTSPKTTTPAGEPDPVAMRASAAAKMGEARQAQADALAVAMRLRQEATQLGHEAGLWEAADAAVGARNALEDMTGVLEDAEKAARAAKQEAENKLAAVTKHRARAKAAATKADNGSDYEAQGDAAVRLVRAERGVTEASTELAGAVASHEGAVAALEAHSQAVIDAQAAVDTALDAAVNPGRVIAANTSPFAPGISTLDDMSPGAREAVGLVAVAMAGATSSAPVPAARPSNPFAAARAEMASRDPSAPQYRTLPDGRTLVIQPPARRS